MATVTVSLPDDLVESATRSGLLSPERLEATLREQLRAEAGAQLREIREKLKANPLPPMSKEEIQAEVDEARTELRRAARH